MLGCSLQFSLRSQVAAGSGPVVGGLPCGWTGGPLGLSEMADACAHSLGHKSSLGEKNSEEITWCGPPILNSEENDSYICAEFSLVSRAMEQGRDLHLKIKERLRELLLPPLARREVITGPSARGR